MSSLSLQRGALQWRNMLSDVLPILWEEWVVHWSGSKEQGCCCPGAMPMAFASGALLLLLLRCP